MTYDWTLYFSLFLGIWTALVGGTFKAFSEFHYERPAARSAFRRHRVHAAY